MLRMILPCSAIGLLGITVGIVGTGGHRYEPPWGSVCVLVLVTSAAAFARAWKSWTGLLVFASMWMTIVLLLYFSKGPGNSVVILDDGLGKAWIYGGALAAASAVLIPGKYFREGRHGRR